MNFNKKHPFKKWATLIDYDIVTIMIPFAIVGSAIGALVNYFIPDLIIVILLTLSLLGLLITTTNKMIKMIMIEKNSPNKK